MTLRALAFAPIAFAVLANAAQVGAGERVSVNTSRGVSQPFEFFSADTPKAGLVLFVGGDGSLGSNAKNFLTRIAGDLAGKGFLVALVDMPSDKEKANAKFRISKKHADDIAAVIKYLKRTSNVPVWLVGTSMGTFSAASVAIKKQKLIAGVVLTSSVTRSKPGHKYTAGFPDGVLGLNLQKLKKPVLIVYHRADACSITPPADGEKIKSKLKRSPKVELAMVDGGKPAKSEPCKALSAHGFFGVEWKAVDKIVSFIAP